MPFQNYTELQAEVIGFLGDRVDLVSKVPSFIALGETTIQGELRCREFHERALALLTEEYEFLPPSFAAVDYVVVQDGKGKRQRLNYRTMPQLDNRNASHGGTTPVDLPCDFSIVGEQIRFSPPPSAFVTPAGVDPDLQPERCRNFEIVYWQKPPPLTADTPSNKALLAYPSLYLYATLIAAEPYIVNDARLPMWVQQYSAALERANVMERVGTLATLQVSMPDGACP